MRTDTYISYRKTKRTVKYKLRKRIEKTIQMIKDFKSNDRLSILDVGAADGTMLAKLKESLSPSICLGIEPVMDFILSNTNDSQIIQAKGEMLPFRAKVFDVITAASVLDHIHNPDLFLRECKGVLKDGGIVVISLVSPFYDRLAVWLKIKEDDHIYHFTDRQLKMFLEDHGFYVLEVSRFALPFFGIFLEDAIEKLFNAIGFRWPMFYIAAAAKVK